MLFLLKEEITSHFELSMVLYNVGVPSELKFHAIM